VLRIDLDRAAMLLDDDVVTDRKAEASTFSSWLGREERIEHFFFHIRGDASAVITNGNLDTVAAVLGHCRQGGLVVAAVGLCSALSGSVKPVGNQIEQNPRNILWENVGFASIGIKRLFQLDIEPLLLSTRPVIGKIEAFLDERIDIDSPMFNRALPRVQQHVLDEGKTGHIKRSTGRRSGALNISASQTHCLFEYVADRVRGWRARRVITGAALN